MSKLDSVDVKVSSVLTMLENDSKDDNQNNEDYDSDETQSPVDEDGLDNLTNTLVNAILENPLLNISMLPDDIERSLYTTIFDIIKHCV
jgi:hypothetical protein